MLENLSNTYLNLANSRHDKKEEIILFENDRKT